MQSMGQCNIFTGVCLSTMGLHSDNAMGMHTITGYGQQAGDMHPTRMHTWLPIKVCEL